MKSLAVFFVLLSFGLLGCTRGGKDGWATDGGKDLKVRRVKQTDQRVEAEALAKIQALFESNNLSFQGLLPLGVEVDNLGFTHARFDQMFNGLPIFNHELIFHFDKSGRIATVSGQKLEPTEAPSQPEVDEQKAGRIAWAQMERMKVGKTGISLISPPLVAGLGYWQGKAGDLVLVWKVTPEGKEYPQVFVGAQRAGVVSSDSGIRTTKN